MPQDYFTGNFYRNTLHSRRKLGVELLPLNDQDHITHITIPQIDSDMTSSHLSKMSPSRNLIVPGIAGLTVVALIGSYLHELPKRGSMDFNIDPAFDLPRPPTDLPYNKTSNIICMAFMTAIGLSAVLLGARDALRSRTFLPLVLPLSGAMIAFPETFIDVLGCIYYPWSGHNASLHILGREMPPWIPIWFGYGSLMQINLQLLTNKTSTRTLWYFLGLMMVSDLIVEEILLPMGVYHYYGNQPLVVINRFPWWWMAPNSIGVFLATALAYRYRSYLVGRKVLAVLFLTPMSVGGIYGFICFPVWVAINGDYGWLTTQLLGLLTMVLGLVTFAIILEMVLGRTPFNLDSKDDSSRLVRTSDESSDDAFHDDEF